MVYYGLNFASTLNTAQLLIYYNVIQNCEVCFNDGKGRAVKADRVTSIFFNIGKSEQQTGSWTEFEKQKFDSLVSIHGRKFKHIASLMNTRTAEQCRARYSVISSKSTALSHLKAEQLDKLKEAVEKYGLDNFEQLAKEAVLPFTVTELDVRKYYRQELDPKIERTPWTKEELDTMIQLFKELDGRMDLVQSMLPKKRSLKDMWVQYENYCDSHPTTEDP